MSDIERYVREPLSRNVYVIDYVSVTMNQSKMNEWFNWLRVSFPPTSGDFKRPKVTLAYSPVPIDIPPFKYMDFEGDYEQSLPLEEYITITIDNVRKLSVFTDPMGITHAIIEISHSLIEELHRKYNELGAHWYLGEYSPFIILESNTTHTEQSLNEWSLPTDFNWSFDVLKYSRFGETY